MFKYEPLVKTLDNRKKSLGELCSYLNIDEYKFRVKLNGSENISMAVLDGICKYLKCQPNDVMKWADGEGGSRYKINWDRVKDLCSVSGVSIIALSEKCGLERTSLYNASRRDGTLSSWTVNSVCKTLGCNSEDIIK